MPSLFRRKPADPTPEPAPEPAAAVQAPPVPGASSRAARQRGYTPGKGRETPKRTAAQRRRVAEPPPANRREAYRRMRERQREERAERMAGMRAGDEAYLPPRDRGPERALVRDIVDSRRTVGTWFFGGALIVLIGSSIRVPLVALIFNLLWAALALAMVLDSVLICRRVKRLVTQRFPRTTQRMGSLYLYAIMRGVTFRRMRMPQARVKVGEPI